MDSKLTKTYSDFRTLAWPKERDACGVGFVADIKGRKTHNTLERAITALSNLAHRGAVSSDGLTGDGAGVQTQLPQKLFLRELKENGIALENESDLGVGVFFVQNDAPFEQIYALIDEQIAKSALTHLMWRDVPVNDRVLGEDAKMRLPVLRQVFVKRPEGLDDEAFERLLYLTRKRIERSLREADLGSFYIPAFSSRTIVYKGLMVADQLQRFYPDLADPDYQTSIAVFHQRYSTNTQSRWSLAQPFRFLAHNGEINTLQGNVNFMQAREYVLKSDIWGDSVAELLPIIEQGASDSSALDNAFELLVMSGRDPLHAMMMLIPEAYEESNIDPDLRGFYEYHGSLMEPWDGPAAVALSDGRYAVAALDRNGLRPQRYWIGKDGTVVVGSEAGMVPLPDEDIIEKGRLGPGTMIAVDTQKNVLLKNNEIKMHYAKRRPYREWIEKCFVTPKDLIEDELAARAWDEVALRRSQKMFGYSAEDYDRIFEPMAFDGVMPVGSMGDDTPLAVLSEQPQQLYRYFKQRFAQVTNPPIDPLRERLVMSLETSVGPRGSILSEDERSAAIMQFKTPLITETELGWIKNQDHFKVAQFETRFKLSEGPEGMGMALEQLCKDVAKAASDGAGIILLSDRDVGSEYVPIPMFLATAAVHHKLLNVGKRTRTAIVLETGEPREDHHYACLIGYGAALIHPYLAFATARHVIGASRRSDEVSPQVAVKNYIKAVEKGLLKIMSKMGISALSSYRGGQIFESLGVDKDVVERYFTGTPARLGGAGLVTFATDQLRFHAEAFGEDEKLKDRGIYRFRKAGEYHALNPLVFKALHKAVRTESFEAFEDYIDLVDERPATNLRDLIRYKKADKPLDLDDIEPIEAIVKRFTTQAMSHGSVSRETHETLSIAMNRLGAKSNSGEGGEDPIRFKRYEEDHPELSHADWHPKEGDWGNSAIKQVASGRFGVTPEYLISARELEIKMAQGSKPGEGGQIPGFKVSGEIARIRHSIPGVTLISPPPHHDIYSIEDLAQLIYDLKRVNRKARVGVKLVSTDGVGTIASGVAKGYADNIQISGNDGGTGASPLSSVKHAGVPWELGLSETQQSLVESGLRERVSLRVDGGMKTGRDVVIGALLGGEEFGFGTSALVAAGCAMIRQCHLNTCPVGVATQRPDLRAKYPGQPEHVVNFMTYVAQQVRMILAEMGFRSLNDIVGRVDLLEEKKLELAKGAKLDLSSILRDVDPEKRLPRRSTQMRNDRPNDAPLDEEIWLDALYAIETGKPHTKTYNISNRERSLGARLAGEIARERGAEGLSAQTINLIFKGSAGQSFGIFNNRGMHLTLMGEAQDYVGKSMYGGEIVIKPASLAMHEAKENTILGNTVMYGATGGSLYAAGNAGERLCVRNSGGKVVVEGCGDHGCEYMTGGVAVILGETGRNFGAGMSGGIAYIYDAQASFEANLNAAIVKNERIETELDEELLRTMIERHVQLTGSLKAQAILDNWTLSLSRFWKVAPYAVEEVETPQMQDLSLVEQAALEALRLESGQEPAVVAGD